MTVRKVRFPKFSRDLVLFVGGLLGILNEAFLHSGQERPYLLVVFAGMVGLPVFLYQDEHRSSEPELPLPPKPQRPTKEESPSLSDLVQLMEELEKRKK